MRIAANLLKKIDELARIQEKNEPPQNFPLSRFYPMLPRFSQRFPDFSLTKLFKVRKCERCSSLNPRLSNGKIKQFNRKKR